jgi:bifunctional non-homologous end joining protein LigD
MASLAEELGRLGIQNGWLDCEAVVMGTDGIPTFNALQNAFDHTRTEDILLYAFDLPFLDGKDLSALPLEIRRAILKERLPNIPRSASDTARHSAPMAQAFCSQPARWGLKA